MNIFILVLLIVIYVNKSGAKDGGSTGDHYQLLLNYSNYTYKAYSDKKSWDNAKTSCEDENGTLAVLNTTPLLDLVKRNLTSLGKEFKSKDFWIGLRCRYYWANGEILNQNSLNIGEKEDKHCYTIEKDDNDKKSKNDKKHFKKKKCNEEKNFICGFPEDSAENHHPKQLPNDANYTYVRYFDKQSWHDAKTSCEEKNGTLAVLNTKRLLDLVKRNLTSSNLDPKDFWIGLRCRYYWANGEILDQNSLKVDEKNDTRCYTIEKGDNDKKHFKKEKCHKTKKFICGFPKSNLGINHAPSVATTTQQTSATTDLSKPERNPTSTKHQAAMTISATTDTLNTERNPTSTIHQAAMTTSAVSSIVKATPTISSSSSMNNEETSSMQASQLSSSSSSYMGTTSDINPTQTSSVQPSTTARSSTTAKPVTSAKSVTYYQQDKNMINHFHNVMKKLNTSNPDCMSELLTEYGGLMGWLDNQDGHLDYNPLTEAQDIENMALEFTKQHLSSDRKNLSISNKEIAFHAILVDSDSDSDVTFPEAGQDPDVNTISLPKSLFKGQETFVINVVYKNNKTIPRLTPKVMEGKMSWSVNTGIFSMTIFPKRKEPFEYVNITLHHIQKMEYAKPHCSFWNYSIPTSFNGSWSQQGCHVVSSTENRTVCACNHLTNFAVLMNLNPNEVPQIHKEALMVITYVGLALSLLGEAITVLLYCLFLNLRHEKIQIRVNLLCALAAAQIVFLAGIDKIEDKGLCTFVAALIHLLYLVCFCWMLMEGVYLYRMVVKVFDAHVNMRYSYIFAIGFPLCIVASSLIAASAQSEGIYSYISSKYCWVRLENGFIWSFIAPVLMLIAINTFFLFSVLKEMAFMKSVKTINSLELSSIRASARACVIILPLLGITWLFGFLSVFGVWSQYIFTIFNAMQGFMIFVFHCLRNTELRAAIELRYFQWESTHSGHHSHSRGSTPSKFLTIDESEKSRSNSIPMATKVNQVTPKA